MTWTKGNLKRVIVPDIVHVKHYLVESRMEFLHS